MAFGVASDLDTAEEEEYKCSFYLRDPCGRPVQIIT